MPDSAEIATRLTGCLKDLTQKVLKRAVNAWIKGICLQKSVKFPYRKGDEVPEWWPSTDACPFKGPSHIKQRGMFSLRLSLCFLADVVQNYCTFATTFSACARRQESWSTKTSTWFRAMPYTNLKAGRRF